MLVLVSAAWACPVCGAPGASNEWAYVAMTVVLSLLPLGFMGGVGWWIYQHVKAASVEQ
jgi:hypothetical protein